MTFDDELSSLMHRAVATVDPLVAPLVAGGLSRGRRLVRRRRIGYGLSVTAVAGGLAVVVAVATTGGGTPRAGGGGPAPAAHSGTSTTSASIQARERAAAQKQLQLARDQARQRALAAQRAKDAATTATTPQVLLQTALDLLPAGGTTSQYGGTTYAGFVGARFVWDDGQGAAEVAVSIEYPTGDPKGEAVDSPCAAGSSDCTVLPDGGHALVRQGVERSTDGGASETEWDLDLVRSDGTEVSYLEWNAPAQKDVQPTRAEPPFTVAQLTAWADSPTFQTRTSVARAAAARHLFRPSDATPPR